MSVTVTPTKSVGGIVAGSGDSTNREDKGDCGQHRPEHPDILPYQVKKSRTGAKHPLTGTSRCKPQKNNSSKQICHRSISAESLTCCEHEFVYPDRYRTDVDFFQHLYCQKIVRPEQAYMKSNPCYGTGK